MGAARHPNVPGPGECHVWFADLPQDVGAWVPLLAGEDLVATADLNGEVRRIAVVSRGMQRLVVGGYLGIDPSRVLIERACAACGGRGHGRPCAATSSTRTPPRLDYSVSHSAGLVALAVVGPGRVGFDLERLPDRDDPAHHAGAESDLAEYVLGEAELASYRSLPAAKRTGWLHRAWTRKEAVLKATGAGLTVDPARVAADGTHRLPEHPAGPLAGRELHVSDLDHWPEYAAAVASTERIEVTLTRRADRPAEPGRSGRALLPGASTRDAGSRGRRRR